MRQDIAADLQATESSLPETHRMAFGDGILRLDPGRHVFPILRRTCLLGEERHLRALRRLSWSPGRRPSRRFSGAAILGDHVQGTLEAAPGFAVEVNLVMIPPPLLESIRDQVED